MENQNVDWKEIQPNVWKPEKEEDMIEGVLINKHPSTKYDNQIYHIETKDDKQLVVFGTTVLDNRMSYVEVGSRVKITYKGTEKNAKGQDTKIFKVETAK